MAEARRILKPKGVLVVKCGDEISAGKQQRTHIEAFQIAVDELGMRDLDLFILTLFLHTS